MFCTWLALLIAAGPTAVAQADSQPLVYRPSVVLQLAVKDLAKAVEFYQNVLEFRLAERRDDLGFAHIETNVPGLEIGLSAGGQAAGTGGAVVNISVRDIAAARTTLEKRGVVFKGPTRIIPGKVALAEFADPDGNRLRLAGPPPSGHGR